MDVTPVGNRGDDCVGDRVYLTGVSADDEMSQFVDRGFGRGNETVHGRFADSVNIAVRADFDEQPVLPPGTDRIGFNFCDLHEAGLRRAVIPPTGRPTSYCS